MLSTASARAAGVVGGTLNQSGGTVSVPGTFYVSGGSGVTTLNSGVYNLGNGTAASGTLSTSLVTMSSTNTASTGVLNFNGGTLQAVANSTSFVTGLTSVNVAEAGATIDTQAFNVGISQPILHGGTAATDGGLTKIGTGTLTLAAVNTYTGPTSIQAGTLAVANSAALGTGTATLSNGAKLALAQGVQTGFAGFARNSNGNYTAVITGGGTGVTLTNGTGSDATSVFTPTTVSVGDAAGFTASFTYNHVMTGTVGGSADGVTFVFQNQGPTALGGSGGQLAYALGTGTNTVGAAITPSVAVVVDEFKDTLGTGQNGVLNEGTSNSAPGISANTSSLVTVVYNGTAQTLTETVTSGTATYSTVLTGFDLATQLGQTGAANVNGYVGFTGSTGGNSDTQSISNFSFTPAGTRGVSIANGVGVAAASTGTIQLAPSAGFSSGGVGPITIASGGVLTVSIGATPAPGVTRGLLTTPSVTLSDPTSGKLDVGINSLDVTGQNVGAVTALIASAYTGGTWTGPGITTTAAPANTAHNTALGVISNTNAGGTQIYGTGTTLGMFAGTNPGPNDVLVKYTYYGDANLDGVVDGSDYTLIDNGFNNRLTGWYNGDFNYDGTIDGSDYTLIDNAFNTQAAPINAGIVTPLAFIADQIAGTSAVPEPTTLGLVALGAAALLGRRRKA